MAVQSKRDQPRVQAIKEERKRKRCQRKTGGCTRSSTNRDDEDAPDQSSRVFACKLCAKVFKQMGWLDYHERAAVCQNRKKRKAVELVESDTKDDDEDAPDQSSRVFACKLCAKVFKQQAGLNYHERAAVCQNRKKRKAVELVESDTKDDDENAPNQSSRVSTTKCEHGRQRSKCKECGGANICKHGRQRSNCKECGGSGICEHGRRRSVCKECGGGSICQHGRRRSRCKGCGGRGICQHGRRRSDCKECGGGSICQHGRRRSQCKECDGASVCQHGRLRSQCKECATQLAAPQLQTASP
jgi:hypothetical protein